MADSVGDVPASVTQTLTVLSNGFFLPIAAGYAVFFLAVGVLAVRTRVLPVWIVIVSVLLYRRETGPAERRTPIDPASPA